MSGGRCAMIDNDNATTNTFSTSNFNRFAVAKIVIQVANWG